MRQIFHNFGAVTTKKCFMRVVTMLIIFLFFVLETIFFFHSLKLCERSKKGNSIFVKMYVCNTEQKGILLMFINIYTWYTKGVLRQISKQYLTWFFLFRCQRMSWEPRNLFQWSLYKHRWIIPLWVSLRIQSRLYWSALCRYVCVCFTIWNIYVYIYILHMLSSLKFMNLACIPVFKSLFCLLYPRYRWVFNW